MDKNSSYNKMGDGTKAVVSAGTAVALVATSTPCREVTIQAGIENTDTVVVGASTVVATSALRRGVGLEAGQSVTLRVTDLNLLYLDSLVNGESVSFVYFNN